MKHLHAVITLATTILVMTTGPLSTQAQDLKILNVEEDTENGIGVHPCGDRHEAMLQFVTYEPFALGFRSNYDPDLKVEVADKNEEEKKLIISKVKNVDENQIKKNEVKDEETKEQKNDKNIIEENKNNKSDEKEIKKDNEENNENELKKEVPPNHDYVYVPTNFKKLKESVVAENIEDDHDKENNDIKLNVSEKSNENLDLNKI